LYTLHHLRPPNYLSTSIYSYITVVHYRKGVASPSIDSPRCHHRLPTCLLAIQNVTSLPRPCRPHRRLPRSSITSGASCRYRNAEGSGPRAISHLPRGCVPVMNPRPHLALSFAHRRRLLFIFRRLYHAACRTAKPAQTCARVTHSTLPVPMPSRSNVRRGGLSSQIIVSSRLRTKAYLSTNSRYRHCRPRELLVDVPVRARK
jgi:hypothetical protein